MLSGETPAPALVGATPAEDDGRQRVLRQLEALEVRRN
jgi:hypothetical protein